MSEDILLEHINPDAHKIPTMSESQHTPLKPCPFCGEPSSHAIDAWNTRAVEQPLDALEAPYKELLNYSDSLIYAALAALEKAKG